MRVRMLVQMPEGGSRDGEPWPAKGEAIELPTAQAAHLVASGAAEQVPDTPEPRRGRTREKTSNPTGEG